ncbi:MAG: N-acetylmuramic acid 6-phosphate etherase [Limisphaerales bacterium]
MKDASPIFLGVEGGATHSVCLLSDSKGNILKRVEVGPANILLLRDAQFTKLLRQIKKSFADCPAPSAVCLGLAGAHGPEEFERIRRCAEKVWPKLPLKPTHDLETALASLEKIQPARKPAPPRVLVLSGTGSCFVGKHEDKWARFGGWGHVIGDKGSGYEIGLRALKACAFYFDRDGRWTRLGERVLRALNMNHPRDLIPWSPHASKSEIAVVAKEVFAAKKERDPIAKDILTGAANSLAKDAISCARKLVPKDATVQFVLAGSILRKQPGFARQVLREIKSRWQNARSTTLTGESAWGAVVLAAREFQASNHPPANTASKATPRPVPSPTALSPTEQRNPKSANLDRLAIADAIDLMLGEDRRLPVAIAKEKNGIEKVIRAITKAFKNGGRLFYVGAGTSGRLGILDASECPPTFRVDPEMVQGIIAGGANAVFTAVEGAEDSPSQGAEAVKFRGVGKQDVVVGIAASGRTPFVHGALDQAKELGAFTSLLCFNPQMKKTRTAARITIAPDIGPEVLTGSTRLKSGTATKLILNMFTTLAMVRIGKVIGNRMVDLNPSNTKLRDRATRIVQELTDRPAEGARAALEQHGWNVRAAVNALR